MKRIILSIIVAGIWALCFCASLAQAEPITIEIEAQVDSVEDHAGYLEGKINPGDIITGMYTYDTATPDSYPSDPLVGRYSHYSPPAGISLTVAGFHFTTDSSNTDFLVGIANNVTSDGLHDSYWLHSYSNLPLANGTIVDDISWSLRDSTATAVSSIILPTTGPLLDDWQSANILRLSGDRTFLIDAHVTSAIPEPATMILLSLGLLILRARTIENR